jgi:hypothetical protein
LRGTMCAWAVATTAGTSRIRHSSSVLSMPAVLCLHSVLDPLASCAQAT